MKICVFLDFLLRETNPSTLLHGLNYLPWGNVIDVLTSGRDIAVSELLADDIDRNAFGTQFRRVRVAQPVWVYTLDDARLTSISLDHLTHVGR